MVEYEGSENLEKMSHTTKFNNWIYDEVSLGLKGDILEIGSGLGVFSKKIINDFPDSSITLTEISLSYLKILEKKFGDKATVKKLDLNLQFDYEKIGFNKFDSILAVNVLEHVKNDEFAIKMLHKMLKQNGILILFVPCHKFLFNIIDSSIGHYRRYTRKELESKIKNKDFKILKFYYFNMFGILGWFVNGNLRKNPNLSDSSLKLFDMIVPLFQFLEKIICKRLGLSIICFLKKV